MKKAFTRQFGGQIFLILQKTCRISVCFIFLCLLFISTEAWASSNYKHKNNFSKLKSFEKYQNHLLKTYKKHDYKKYCKTDLHKKSYDRKKTAKHIKKKYLKRKKDIRKLIKKWKKKRRHHYQKRIKICHHSSKSDKKHTIKVSKRALKHHLRHGDTLGECTSCGDGVVNDNEQCDGTAGVGEHQECSEECTLVDLPFCGDGIVNNDEQCDGINIISCQAGGYAGVQDCLSSCVFSNCQQIEFCGDGTVQGFAGEQCDDANVLSGDGCSDTCITEFCGDNIVNNGEECDDGNIVSGDTCNGNCLSEFCGDSIITPDLNEICDSDIQSCFTVEGYQGSSTCSVDCSDFEICITPFFCGDGVCQTTAENTFTCTSDCPNVCGDGLLEPGESCDDGNTIPNDGCNDVCEIEFCGDSVVQSAAGEECDDGNTEDNDGCTNNCTFGSCVGNYTWNIVEISDQPSNLDLSVSPDGQYVAWSEFSGILNEDRKIVVHDGTTKTQINAPTNAINPVVNNNGQVIWSGIEVFSSLNSQYQLYFHDGTTTTKLTANPSMDVLDIDLNNNGYVTWAEPFGGNGEIYFFDGTSTTRVTDNSLEETLPKINDNNHIVFKRRNDTITLYDGSSQMDIFRFHGAGEPNINNQDEVAFLGNDSLSDLDPFFYDGTSSVKLSDNTSEEVDPTFINENGHMVWVGGDNVEPNGNAFNNPLSEVMLFDGTNVNQVTNNSTQELRVDISDDNYVAWSGFDGNDFEIFFSDGVTQYQVTDNNFDDAGLTNGDRIFFKGQSIFWQADNKIFKAELTCPSTP